MISEFHLLPLLHQVSAVSVSANSKCSVNTHEKELPIAVPPGQDSEDSDLSLSCLPHPCFGGFGWLYMALSGQSSIRHQEATSPISILSHTWVSRSILCQCIRLAVCLRQRCTWTIPSSLWAMRVGVTK